MGETQVSKQYICLMSIIAKNTDPRCPKEAVKYSLLLQAMNEELEALEENKTWVIT